MIVLGSESTVTARFYGTASSLAITVLKEHTLVMKW